MSKPERQLCKWVREADGLTVLIPGCWSRVHDPDAPCTCGEWDESGARQIIKGLRSHVYHLRSQNSKLRQALIDAGGSDPTIRLLDLKGRTARERRKAMHAAINGDDDD